MCIRSSPSRPEAFAGVPAESPPKVDSSFIPRPWESAEGRLTGGGIRVSFQPESHLQLCNMMDAGGAVYSIETAEANQSCCGKRLPDQLSSKLLVRPSIDRIRPRFARASGSPPCISSSAGIAPWPVSIHCAFTVKSQIAVTDMDAAACRSLTYNLLPSTRF